MKRLVILPQAEADIEEIADYIAADAPERAASFVEELRDRARQLAETPRIFARRDEVSAGVRAARHGAYLLFFRELETEVRLVRILHTARDLRQAFKL